MYSMIMVMALSGTAATPAYDCHGRSCHGSACSGWNGSCSGSCKGGHRLFSKHGRCSGSCSGSCHGTFVKHSGCHGSCSGTACSGSCNGGHRLFSCFKRNSCNGSCSGVVVSNCCGCTGAATTAPAGQEMKKPAEPKKAEPKPPAASNAAPAKVLVSLPVDAKLFIDGHVTTSTTNSRTFVSPALEAGKDYVYTLKVEMVRNGLPVEESKTVTVRAGETTEVSFSLETTVAAK